MRDYTGGTAPLPPLPARAPAPGAHTTADRGPKATRAGVRQSETGQAAGREPRAPGPGQSRPVERRPEERLGGGLAQVLAGEPADLFDRMCAVSLPMVARFRGITVREALLLRGPAGWAEFSPFAEYAVPEASTWLAAAIEAATSPFPPPRRPAVAVNATLPAVPAERVAEVLARYDGAQCVKIKIADTGAAGGADDAGGAGLEEDLARIAAVRAAAPGMRVRLDANGRYGSAQARTALARFARLPGFAEACDYIEQPVMDVRELADLRAWAQAERLGLRIAADESIRKAEDPLTVARLGAADHIIVKAQPLGGVRRALSIVEQAGLPATVSSALETSVGLAAGAALAASLPPVAAGLGTSALFERDVAQPPLRAVGGELPVGRVEPDAKLLAELDAGPVRTAWWARRLEACWEHLRGRVERGEFADHSGPGTSRAVR